MRVKKLAAELNYEPDNRAIFFKQQKTFTIGVVLPNLSEAFFSTAISAIEDMATAHNYTVILGQSLDDEARELKILDSFTKHRVAGIDRKSVVSGKSGSVRVELGGGGSI